MKRISTALAVATLLTSGALYAQAQPASPPSSPSPSSPSSQSEEPTSPNSDYGSSSSSTESQDEISSMTNESTRSQMKSCVAQSRAQNPNMSDQAIKQACRAQVSGTSPQR